METEQNLQVCIMFSSQTNILIFSTYTPLSHGKFELNRRQYVQCFRLVCGQKLDLLVFETPSGEGPSSFSFRPPHSPSPASSSTSSSSTSRSTFLSTSFISSASTSIPLVSSFRRQLPTRCQSSGQEVAFWSWGFLMICQAASNRPRPS